MLNTNPSRLLLANCAALVAVLGLFRCSDGGSNTDSSSTTNPTGSTTCGALNQPCCASEVCEGMLFCYVGQCVDQSQADVGKPCGANSECLNDLCLPIDDDSQACTAPCADEGACPPGWACDAVLGLEGDWCQCTVTPETCDGLDNDCDGVIDNNAADDECDSQATGEVCEAGVCECALTCAGQCTNPNTSADHCGGCDQPCSGAPNAPGACVNGDCGFVCATDFQDCDGDAANGCEVAEASALFWDCDGDASNGCETDFTATTLRDCDNVAATGCETDIANTDEHCGACGQPCNGDQKCVGGECKLQPTVIASNVDSVTGMAATPQGVFWATGKTGQQKALYKATTGQTPGTPITLNLSSAAVTPSMVLQKFHADPTHLYFLINEDNPRVARVGLNSTTVTIVGAMGGGLATDLVLNNSGSVYVSQNAGGVKSVPKGGGAITNYTTAAVRKLAMREWDVFYNLASNNEVRKFSIVPPYVDTTFGGASPLSQMVTTASRLYYDHNGGANNLIYSRLLTNGATATTEETIPKTTGYYGGFAVSETHLFWSDNGVLKRRPLSGGTADILVEPPLSQSPTSLKISGAFIYFYDLGMKTVSRLPI